MNTKYRVPLILALGLTALAANAGGEDDDGKTSSSVRKYQTSDVVDMNFANPSYQGAAWLVRSVDGIQGRIMTRVSEAGLPYTLWVLIYNHPDACEDACDPSDLGRPGVDGVAFNGSGAIGSATGDGGGLVNIDFNITDRRLPRNLFVLFGDRRGLHRRHGFRAEVQLVIDKHDAIAPGTISWIRDLTTTNFPGDPQGTAVGDRRAVFKSCPASRCPGSVF